MPYVSQGQRVELFDYGRPPRDAGELNYILTTFINDYWSNGGRYQQANDVLGALEGAKLEFYRRVVVPYEEDKIQENGDVYGV